MIANCGILSTVISMIFCTAWRAGLRRFWDLPSTTHSDLLHAICDDLPIHDELCRRTLMFIRKCFFAPLVLGSFY